MRLLAIVVAVSAAACGRPQLARPAAPAPDMDPLGPSLTGQVRDDITDAPVAGPQVGLVPEAAPGGPPVRAGRTDARGAYWLRAVPAGRYALRVRGFGYRAEVHPVQVGDCGALVRGPDGRTAYCVDRKYVYLTSLARF